MSTDSSRIVHNASLPDVLNHFYANFDRLNTETPIKTLPPPDGHVPLPSEVRSSLNRVNWHKAAGPDGIPEPVIRACGSKLAEVFINIFNLSSNAYKSMKVRRVVDQFSS